MIGLRIVACSRIQSEHEWNNIFMYRIYVDIFYPFRHDIL